MFIYTNKKGAHNNMKLKAGFVLGLVVSVFASLSVANASHYGMAGCGVGALIFKDKPGKIQILAGTTNSMFYQTFSISSQTSGCTDNPDDVASLFININRSAIQKEISKGEGETLTTLSKIYDCKEAASFGKALQTHYSEIFSETFQTSKELHSNIKDVVKSDSVLKNACGIVS